MIRSRVSPRLLSKAGRLFTGTQSGRIIEILQNARRAAATIVAITNQDGLVTIRDNGRGISDFQTLLDLGASGWDSTLEASEDPAGVGLFCLSPRKVIIRSQGRSTTIEGNGWTGAPVEVEPDSNAPATGMEITFSDEPWSYSAVNPLAVFTGLQVTVDGQACDSHPFIAGEATHFSEMGCRIAVVPDRTLTHTHRGSLQGFGFRLRGVLVNFHGQVVFHDYWPLSETGLIALVDLTGEPTGIRLMLPARTRLVENDAIRELEAAIEKEIYRCIQRRGTHTLPYKEFNRAKVVGVDLPEAEPKYQVGLLASNMGPEPIEVIKPEDLPLERCYRLSRKALEASEAADSNAHLLAALWKFDQPFVPVEIQERYEGYSWTNLHTIDSVEVVAGKVLLEEHVWLGRIRCVESLLIRARTSDGRTWESDVSLAVCSDDDDPNDLYATPAAQSLHNDVLWHHLGGWLEESDTYERQESDFAREIDQFWALLLGPDEPLRRKLLDALADMEKPWKSVMIGNDRSVEIEFEDGGRKTISPLS